jgi:hypothetical protein
MIPDAVWSFGRALYLASGLVFAVGAVPATADDPSLYPTDYVYRDLAGDPLPFQDKDSILEALRTGEIVDRELMSRGIANNVKLTLEHGGARFHAVLRLIDVTEREETGSLRMVVKYRDTYIFEAAAYELNELLGIGRIPPTVLRRVDGAPGSVQIWMEGMKPEDLMLKDGELNPPDRGFWWRQKGIMWVLDALIANTDRNQGNLLIDEEWNLWFIDHTRAFRETSVLLGAKDLDLCERTLWNALQTVDDDEIRQRMEPYLSSDEIKKLLLRKKKLIKHFTKRIGKKGEDKVLYTLGG